MKIWPFKKPASRPKRSVEDRVNDLKTFRDVGEEFSYLDVRCRVTDHSELIGMSAGLPRVIAVLKADYVTQCGEIKQLTLSYPEAMRLAKEELTE